MQTLALSLTGRGGPGPRGQVTPPSTPSLHTHTQGASERRSVYLHGRLALLSGSCHLRGGAAAEALSEAVFEILTTILEECAA